MPKQISLSKELAEKVEKAAKDQGLTVEEYIAKRIREECGEVEVTFKMPADLLRMLEEEEFFTWQRNAFFFNAVKRMISCELSEIEVGPEYERLDEKFGKEYRTVYVSEKK